MKLYATSKLSPFASRPRMAVYAKTLPVEILAAPGDGGPHHPDYLAINPIGKIPALQLDDGSVIVESDTIVEYFADAFPEARLRPDGAEAIARGRMLGRIAELYVMEGAVRLFSQMDPATRTWSVAKMNPTVVAEAFARIDKALGDLDHFMGETKFAAADHVTSADCAIVPVLAFISAFADALGRDDFLDGHPKVDGYWKRAQADPAVAKITGEVRGAVQERIKP